MDIKLKYLNKIVNEKIFVDIYTDHYDESRFGYVLDFNDNFLLLECFTDESKFDGIIAFHRENITRIRWGGNEISSAAELIEKPIENFVKGTIDLTNMRTILKGVSENYGYVNVSIEDIDSGVCFIGEISEMDEQTIVLNEYGSKISLDRKNIMLSIQDITMVQGGGVYEENLISLFKNEN
jgi:hypothetical protein